nr:MAG TPA: hypothetical protein [Caudoviricetes sp.]
MKSGEGRSVIDSISVHFQPYMVSSLSIRCFSYVFRVSACITLFAALI